MPITFKTDTGKKYYISLWKGEISDNELSDSYKEFLEGPDWTPLLNELADLSDIKFTSLSSGGLAQFSSYIEMFLKEHEVEYMRTAVYCTDALPEGMAKLYKSLSEKSPEEVAIFDNFHDAESWANIRN